LVKNFRLFEVFSESMKPPYLLKTATLVLAFYALVGCSTAKPQGPPAVWRNVNGGMTQQEISKLLGPPSQPSSQGGEIWIKSGWELQVDYDQYGHARNILSHPIGK